MLRGMYVHWNQGLPVNKGIIYDNMSSRLKMTPLDIKFNDYENPEVLHVNEKLYAWFTNKKSGMKINISDD